MGVRSKPASGVPPLPFPLRFPSPWFCFAPPSPGCVPVFGAPSACRAGSVPVPPCFACCLRRSTLPPRGRASWRAAAWVLVSWWASFRLARWRRPVFRVGVRAVRRSVPCVAPPSAAPCGWPAVRAFRSRGRALLLATGAASARCWGLVRPGGRVARRVSAPSSSPRRGLAGPLRRARARPRWSCAGASRPLPPALRVALPRASARRRPGLPRRPARARPALASALSTMLRTR